MRKKVKERQFHIVTVDNNYFKRSSTVTIFLIAHNLAVVSFHTRYYLNQAGPSETDRLDTGWAFTRRQAAVCWG